MFFSCLFLVLLSSACFLQADAQHGNFGHHRALEQFGYMDEMRARGHMGRAEDFGDGWSRRMAEAQEAEEAEEAAAMAMRAADNQKKTQELLAGSLDAVVNLMDTLLKGVKDAKAGKSKRAASISAELDKHLREANKFAKLLEEHNRSS